MDGIWLKTSRFLHDVEKCIREDVSQVPVLKDLPFISILLLASLYDKDKRKASELAASVNAAATSFTPTIDRLENLGLLTRSNHPTDRRAVIISLTKEGEKYRQVVENAFGNAEVRYGGK